MTHLKYEPAASYARELSASSNSHLANSSQIDTPYGRLPIVESRKGRRSRRWGRRTSRRARRRRSIHANRRNNRRCLQIRWEHKPALSRGGHKPRAESYGQCNSTHGGARRMIKGMEARIGGAWSEKHEARCLCMTFGCFHRRHLSNDESGVLYDMQVCIVILSLHKSAQFCRELMTDRDG